MMLLVLDPAGGGPAVGVVERLGEGASVTIPVGPLGNDDLAAVIAADGVETDAVASILAVAPPFLAPHRAGPANSNGALLPAALALFLVALAAGSLLRLAARLPTTPGWR